MFQFRHLQVANQTYLQHFGDSIKYCGKALMCAVYFLCHAVYPDVCETAGSRGIAALKEDIDNKYKAIETSSE
jgi:hypothetical protein